MNTVKDYYLFSKIEDGIFINPLHDTTKTKTRKRLEDLATQREESIIKYFKGSGIKYTLSKDCDNCHCMYDSLPIYLRGLSLNGVKFEIERFKENDLVEFTYLHSINTSSDRMRIAEVEKEDVVHYQIYAQVHKITENYITFLVFADESDFFLKLKESHQ